MSENEFGYGEEIEVPVVKVITVAGRASSMSEFEDTLNSHLSQPFKLKAILPLEQDDEAKNFLAYIDPGSDWREVDDYSYEALAEFLAGSLYSVEIHENPDEAKKFVNREYKDRIFAPFRKPISAQEIAKRDILYALIGANETGIVRGLLDNKPVIVIIHGAEGTSEAKDTFVTPYAIMVDDDLGSRLVIPFNSSYDKRRQ